MRSSWSSPEHDLIDWLTICDSRETGNPHCSNLSLISLKGLKFDNFGRFWQYFWPDGMMDKVLCDHPGFYIFPSIISVRSSIDRPITVVVNVVLETRGAKCAEEVPDVAAAREPWPASTLLAAGTTQYATRHGANYWAGQEDSRTARRSSVNACKNRRASQEPRQKNSWRRTAKAVAESLLTIHDITVSKQRSIWTYLTYIFYMVNK